MSNAWEDDRPVPTARSGMGCEFILETTEAGQWPILRLLHVMACQILVCHGRFPGRPPLSEFDRIPLKCAIDGNDSKLRSIMLTPSPHGTELRLESGTFDFLQLIGITDDEVLYAKENGGTKLLGRQFFALFYKLETPAQAL